MRHDVVVNVTPDSQLASGICEVVQQRLVEQLVAQRPVERLNRRIALRLARVDIVSFDQGRARPPQDCPARKLRPVIADDASRFAIQPRQRVQLLSNRAP